jgi:hypothetical protein
MSLTGHDKEDLFDITKVIRHSDRMGVWLYLLNLEKDNILLQGLSHKRYTPRSNDSNYWIDLLTRCGEYLGFNAGHLTLTEAGQKFKQDLANTIAEKHPLQIMCLDVKPAKRPRKNQWDHDDDMYNKINLQCIIGKKEIDIQVSCDRSESYYAPGTFDESVNLMGKDHSEKDYNYYTPANLMKPIILQTLNGDSFINKLKEKLTDDQRVKLAGFVLKSENCWRQLL